MDKKINFGLKFLIKNKKYQNKIKKSKYNIKKAFKKCKINQKGDNILKDNLDVNYIINNQKKSNKKRRKSFIFKLILLVLSAIFVTVAIYSFFSYLFFKNFEQYFSQFEILGIKASPLIILVFIFLISTLLGCVLSLIMIKGFYKPINKLKNAMNKVSKGEFEKVENNNSDDEIAELIEIYNKMVSDLKNMEIISNDFVSAVSHEIKTPLSSIKGYASMLKNQDISKDEKLKYINKILIATDNLSNLTNNILNISKIENTALIKNKNFSLDEQLRECILLLENKWSEKNLNLVINIEPINIFSNKELCQSVFVNILENAIKFTPTNKNIKINLFKICKNSSDYAVFEVQDSGVGISQKNLTRIFDKFFQADSSRMTEGNGLGLALVKKIMDRLNGIIEVESSLGIGSCFKVYFPLNKKNKKS